VAPEQKAGSRTRIAAYVKPALARSFEERAAKAGLEKSQAIREALLHWIDAGAAADAMRFEIAALAQKVAATVREELRKTVEDATERMAARSDQDWTRNSERVEAIKKAVQTLAALVPSQPAHREPVRAASERQASGGNPNGALR
jgi:hypothetical protein